MNKKLQYIIAVAAIGLIGLVVLQVNWVNHAAQLREDQFAHRINMALRNVVDSISSDSQACKSLSNVRYCNSDEFELRVEDFKKGTKVDSLLKHELNYHNIDLPYDYGLARFGKKPKESLFTLAGLNNEPYALSLCKIPQASGLELTIHFPDKGRYIYAKMGMMLFSSVALVLLLIASFIASIVTILKQKRIHSMTTEFITNMTHEFKTPLATIALASSMLRKGKVANNPDKAKKYADVINEENQKLREHVEQVLNMAKLERGEFRLQKCKTNMNEVIEKAIASIEMQVQNRGGNIRYIQNADFTEIEVDVLHMTNVIANLLDNANKYSPETPEITITTKNQSGELLISVADNGIGMSKDKQKMVFDKFYRVPTGNVHDVKGFGLGLAYVKMIVERHGGSVQVTSDLDKGSNFEVRLPIGEPHKVQVAA